MRRKSLTRELTEGEVMSRKRLVRELTEGLVAAVDRKVMRQLLLCQHQELYLKIFSDNSPEMRQMTLRDIQAVHHAVYGFWLTDEHTPLSWLNAAAEHWSNPDQLSIAERLEECDPDDPLADLQDKILPGLREKFGLDPEASSAVIFHPGVADDCVDPSPPPSAWVFGFHPDDVVVEALGHPEQVRRFVEEGASWIHWWANEEA